MLTTSTMPTTNVMSVSPFATTTPPPPPLVVPIDLTDLHHSPLASILDLEDLDPAQKPSDDPIRPATSSSGSMRFRPYNTRGRPKTMANKGKRRAESSPLSSVPPSPNPCTSPTPSVSRKGSPSPTPRAGPSSVRRQIAAVPLRIARPKNATRQNLQNLLGWDADEYKDFRAAITLGCRRLLDSSRSWQAQDAEKLSRLKEEILSDFQLQRYQDAWPFEIAVQATLKSSAAALKKNVA